MQSALHRASITESSVRMEAARRSRRGFTFLELSIATVVLLVAAMALGGLTTGLSKEGALTRERAAATWAACDLLETMRNTEFNEIYARYNSTTADDPVIGDSPGHRFGLLQLTPPADSPDGLHGEITFPTVTTPTGELSLREDLDLELFGGPRDLDGNNLIDEADHAEDYRILPVRILVRWTGTAGPAEYELQTVLCEFRKSEGP